MAYLGSTQASSLANPPRNIVSRFAGAPGSTQLSTAVPADGARSAYATQGGGLWLYSSSHGSTACMDTNFFSDAWNIGMRPGDVLIGVQWTTLGSSLVTFIGTIGAVSTSGAALSTGGTMTSTFG